MPASNPPLHLRFELFELDEREARLLHRGQPVAMAPKVFGVLCALARRPGQLIGKSELLDLVWGHQFVSDSVLKSTISDLRAALGDDARSPRYIETASRRGYRFIGAGSAVAAAGAMSAPQPAATSLVGRRSELDRLRACWRAATEGRRQVVWVAGEAGIGKTTLIERFVAGLGSEVRVARGQCVEQHGAGEPYLPVLEAVGELCREDASLLTSLRSVAPTWWLQLPWLGSEGERESLRRELAGIGPERMLREFGEWLDRCTQQRPLLLVTEDLHWSDHATVRLIDHVARRRGRAALAWVSSYRLAEVVAGEHPLKALRHELRLHRLAEEIALEPFSEQDVADYLAQRDPSREVPESTVRRLHRRTDGLPLFLASVLDDWEGQGRDEALDDDDGPPVPESLAGVIEKQIARLEPEDRGLLEAASICGVEFAASVAAVATGRDAAWAAERFDALVRRQQWLADLPLGRFCDGSVEARYAFRHALYRQVFYRRCSAMTQVRLHGRVAAALTQCRAAGRPVAAAELALHCELSHDLVVACRHYAEAAESALQHFAPAQAMDLTSHGLSLLPRCPEGPERLALEMALLGPRTVAASQVFSVTAPQTRAAFERLDQLCEMLPPPPSRALELGFGWVLFVGGEYELALAHAGRKLALAEQRGDAVLRVAACNLHGAVLAFRGELAESRRWLERGVAEAVSLGGGMANALTVVDLEVSLRSRLCQVLSCQGLVDQARQQLAAAHARVSALGQPYTRRLVLIFESLMEMRLGNAPRVLALAQELERVAELNAIAQAEGPTRWMRGWALARLGDPVGGHALIEEGYAADVRLGVMRGRCAVLGFAAEALVLAERWDDAELRLGEALALAGRQGERLYRPELLMLRSRIAQGRGDAAAARSALQAARAEAVGMQSLWHELQAAVALAELRDATPADRDALATVRSQLHEGRAEPLVMRADELLGARA